MNRNIITARDAAYRNAHLGGDGEKARADGYLDRLLKLIPPEVILAFSASQAVIVSWQSPHRLLASWSMFALFLLGVPFYLREVGAVQRWTQVLVSMAAYVFWAAGSSGPPFELEPQARTLLLIVGGFVLPLLPLESRRKLQPGLSP